MIENLLRPGHVLVILAVYLIFWGPAKLPAAARSVALAIKEFKKTMAEVTDAILHEPPPSDPTVPPEGPK